MKPRSLILLVLSCVTAVAQSGKLDRIKFQAYDGDPRKTSSAEMTFQVNALDSGRRTKFVRVGDVIEGTKWKVTKFEFKEKPAEKTVTGEPEDVSELTLQHTETKRMVVLILNKAINAAE